MDQNGILKGSFEESLKLLDGAAQSVVLLHSPGAASWKYCGLLLRNSKQGTIRKKHCCFSIQKYICIYAHICISTYVYILILVTCKLRFPNSTPVLPG